MRKHRSFYNIDVFDLEGYQYSADDINQMDDMPAGTEFKSFTVIGDLISRLPRNLHIQGDLSLTNTTNLKEIPERTVVDGAIWLRNSQVELLPSGLVVGTLTFSKDSLITNLPDDLSVGTLDLRDSNVASIGNNIECSYLFLNDPRMLTNVIISDRVTIEWRGGPLDLSNIRANSIVIDLMNANDDVKQTNSLSNVKAEVLTIRLSNYTEAVTWTITDANIDHLFVHDTQGQAPSSLHLVCGTNFSCSTLDIDGANPVTQPVELYGVLVPVHRTDADLNPQLNIEIDGALIDRIVVHSDVVERTRLTGYALCNDLRVAALTLPSSLLPSSGLIYGNLILPIGYNPPPDFKCLGEVDYVKWEA